MENTIFTKFYNKSFLFMKKKLDFKNFYSNNKLELSITLISSLCLCLSIIGCTSSIEQNAMRQEIEKQKTPQLINLTEYYDNGQKSFTKKGSDLLKKILRSNEEQVADIYKKQKSSQCNACKDPVFAGMFWTFKVEKKDMCICAACLLIDTEFSIGQQRYDSQNCRVFLVEPIEIEIKEREEKQEEDYPYKKIRSIEYKMASKLCLIPKVTSKLLETICSLNRKPVEERIPNKVLHGEYIEGSVSIENLNLYLFIIANAICLYNENKETIYQLENNDSLLENQFFRIMGFDLFVLTQNLIVGIVNFRVVNKIHPNMIKTNISEISNECSKYLAKIAIEEDVKYNELIPKAGVIANIICLNVINKANIVLNEIESLNLDPKEEDKINELNPFQEDTPSSLLTKIQFWKK